ncbi:TonB-dependent receptor [Pseudoduganella sp. OTU4001]|uniref:TonB-dependent receptor n=1 Tax=Pseudoduganella sp. OTU4001 TaxID=3043854 RepID=UPI00313EF7C6
MVSSVAYAQSSEGSIFGKGQPGAKVTITSAETGFERTVTVDASGSYTAAKLQPGTYRVVSNGVTREITVAIGSGTNVNLTAASEPEIAGRVVVSRARSAIDVSSVESNTVFSAEQMAALPVIRDVNAVATLAPGVLKGDPDLGAGGLPAFAGASVAENGYYINGFDVTNIRNFLSYSNLPFDAIAAQQVKSGGYGAEYGRALGGVISLVTKRGTNTWKTGGAIYTEPNSLRGHTKDILDKNYVPGGTDSRYISGGFNSANKTSTTEFDVYAGGPLVQDKLFMFAIVEGKHNVNHVFEQNKSYKSKNTQPNGMIKLDYTPNDSHRIEFTGLTHKRKIEYTDYPVNDEARQYLSTHTGTPEASERKGGGHTLIGKYTGYLTDNFTLSALFGTVDEKGDKTTGARTSSEACPTVYSPTVAFMGCWKEPFATAVRDPAAPDDKDERKAFRIDGEYVWGDHTIRGGIDSQKFSSTAAGSSSYSGGVYWRYLTTASGTINGVANAVAPGTTYVRKRTSLSTSGTFDADNDAYYIEDSWKMNKNWLLYGGLRWESFDNKNSDGKSFVKADNQFAPRIGFAWDVNGNSTMKVFGNAGRYFIPVAVNTNIRATRGEVSTEDFYKFTGMDPVTKAPLGLSAPIGVSTVNGSLTPPNPATVASTSLKPMSQDEFILGAQWQIVKGWDFGMRGIYRKVNDGMDDYCSHLAFEKWAEDNGYHNFDSGTMAQCLMVNPGRDVTLQMDVNNDGKLKEVTVPNSYIGLAKYTRTYKALELTLERPFNGTWGVNASYVLSKSTGTAEGYVSSIINQEDAGVSQDFDFPSLTHGADGPLPGDRRHVLKSYGLYQLNENFRIGYNAQIASGRPISCIGFVPSTAADYSDARNYTTGSAYYCVNDQGKSELHQRGTFGRTPWTTTLDMNLAYIAKFGQSKLTVQLDVFNILNRDTVNEVQERKDYSRATTSATEGRVNLNWKSPTSYQEPRSVRLTARYEY